MLRLAAAMAAAFGLGLALLAWSGQDVAGFLAGDQKSAAVSQTSMEQAPQTQPVAREVSEKTDLYTFDYTYPAMAAAIPGLAALLDTRIEESKAKLDAEAREARKEAKANGYPFQPHYYDAGWDISADIPGWLALGAAIQTYGGGAHPNHDFDALVWDRKAARALDPLDLFVSAEALDAALHARYCAALDKERAERREQSIEEVRKDEMWACPGVARLVILLQSSGGRGFDHLLLLAAPYVAGPYVEGSYETELAVDAQVLAAVRPEFRSVFRLGR